MKKLLFVMLAIFGLSLVSCDSVAEKTEAVNDSDTVQVDTAAVDTAVVDTVE